ncbi:22 kDa protein [Turkey adenovirus 1]|uniref:22 kDa protein n=1 Tax=Turkey adenovirus 1 TaxID=878329 RepID=E0YC73_9ADEN|nr:22 kDa protein [Turkey adenovirus 1]ADM53806.1 22 kDa protein [Turkey adenovirus 1]
MAQRMVDEKARAEEPPPGPEETGRPSDPAALAAPADPLAPTDDVSDGETLGSQDTYSQEEDSEEDYTEEEEEEDEQEQGGEEEPTDPLLQHRHPSQSPLARPPIKRREPPAPRRPPSSPAEPPRERATKKRRGNYRSWARHRVAICKALRDAVFDRRQAGQILKRTLRLYVPATVLGYYARKLCAGLLSYRPPPSSLPSVHRRPVPDRRAVARR